MCRAVACHYDAAVPELSAGLPPLPGLPWESMSHRQVLAELTIQGWVPCGVALGVAAVHVHRWGSSAFWQGNTFTNAEMVSPTAGMQLARSRAHRAFHKRSST